MGGMNTRTAEVVVCGGGPGGFTAAIAAAREGKETILIEKHPFLGGMAVSGLPWLAFMDRHGNQIVHGIPDELVRRLQETGGATEYLLCPAHAGYVAIDPEQVKYVVAEMCREAGVRVVFHSQVGEAIVSGNLVKGVVAHGKDGATAYMGDMVVDATGDGDVAASAGCKYQMGGSRGELQPVTMLLRLGQVDIDAFRRYLEEHPEECSVHAGFGAEIPYQTIRSKDRFIFIGLPALLKRAEIEEGYLNAVDRISFVTNPVPGTITINCTRIGDIRATRTEDLSRAELEGRQQAMRLARFLTKYVPGMQNALVLATGHQIGVRESRRINGHVTLTEQDAINCIRSAEGVARGAYAVDIHDTHGSGIAFQPIDTYFDIPYGCLVPKGVDGLVVSGRAVSVDRVAFGASRVMGTCMAIGQAAGVAASMAINAGIQPAGLPATSVAQALVERGMLLEYAAK